MLVYALVADFGYDGKAEPEGIFTTKEAAWEHAKANEWNIWEVWEYELDVIGKRDCHYP